MDAVAEPEIVDETAAMTIKAAHTAFEIAERELWAEYARDPTYLQGRMYIAGEQLLRRRRDRAISRIRFRRFD